MAQDERFGFILVGIAVGLILGLLISLAFRKPRSKIEKVQQAQQAPPPELNAQPPFQAPPRAAASHARRCPVCNSTYTDEALIYCVSDGASLVPVVHNSSLQDPGATLVYREGRNRDVPPTVPSSPDENQR